MAGKDEEFQVNSKITNNSDDIYSQYIRQSVPKLLDLLAEYNTQITFFVTGGFHQRFAEITRKIADNGHEIGYHGHTHRRIETVEILEQQLKASSDFLERYRPKGFRAPWIYLPDGLLPVLRKHGFMYDSSTFGIPGQQFEKDGMQIFPVSSLCYSSKGAASAVYPKVINTKMLLREIPFGSGMMISYLRKTYSKILGWYAQKNASCIFYLHLCQLYPRLDKKCNLWRDKMRYIRKFPLTDTLRYLLSKHDFRRMDKLLDNTSVAENTVPHFLTIDLELQDEL